MLCKPHMRVLMIYCPLVLTFPPSFAVLLSTMRIPKGELNLEKLTMRNPRQAELGLEYQMLGTLTMKLMKMMTKKIWEGPVYLEKTLFILEAHLTFNRHYHGGSWTPLKHG